MRNICVWELIYDKHHYLTATHVACHDKLGENVCLRLKGQINSACDFYFAARGKVAENFDIC